MQLQRTLLLFAAASSTEWAAWGHLVKTAPHSRKAGAAGEVHASASAKASQSPAQPGPEDATAASPRRRALVVDAQGPSRAAPNGFHVMSMIMDLTSDTCGYDVDVLTNTPDLAEVRRSWDGKVAAAVFQKAHLQDASFKPQFADYQKIVIFAKPDMAISADAGATVVGNVINALTQSTNVSRYRDFTSVHWVDQPFERCAEMADADNLCKRLPVSIKRVSKAAREFHVGTQEDRISLVRSLKAFNIEADVSVWPLRIRHMLKLVHQNSNASQERQLTPRGEPHDEEQPQFLVMNGRINHAKIANLEVLFSSGALADVCTAIRMRRRSMRVLFMGPLAGEAGRLYNAHHESQGLDCVSVHQGYVDEYEYRRDVLPRMQAVLNPLFSKITAGSTTNIEAIAQGIPTITSQYGTASLRELEDCQLPTHGEKPQTLAQYINDQILDSTKYKAYAQSFRKLRTTCAISQDKRYHTRDVCT